MLITIIIERYLSLKSIDVLGAMRQYPLIYAMRRCLYISLSAADLP